MLAHTHVRTGKRMRRGQLIKLTGVAQREMKEEEEWGEGEEQDWKESRGKGEREALVVNLNVLQLVFFLIDAFLYPTVPYRAVPYRTVSYLP